MYLTKMPIVPTMLIRTTHYQELCYCILTYLDLYMYYLHTLCIVVILQTSCLNFTCKPAWHAMKCCPSIRMKERKLWLWAWMMMIVPLEEKSDWLSK